MIEDTDLALLVQVSDCRRTVWVHGADGSTVGRFSTVFGMDIHRTVTEQLAGAGQCLRCTHEKPSRKEWVEFCELMQLHYGVEIDQDLIQVRV